MASDLARKLCNRNLLGRVGRVGYFAGIYLTSILLLLDACLWPCGTAALSPLKRPFFSRVKAFLEVRDLEHRIANERLERKEEGEYAANLWWQMGLAYRKLGCEWDAAFRFSRAHNIAPTRAYSAMDLCISLASARASTAAVTASCDSALRLLQADIGGGFHYAAEAIRMGFELDKFGYHSLSLRAYETAASRADALQNRGNTQEADAIRSALREVGFSAL